MKNVTMAIAATIMLAVIATGVVGGEKTEKPSGTGRNPVILTDATWTDNIWTVGSSGFFLGKFYAGTLYTDTHAYDAIPVGGNSYFEGPLTVPSTVKGKPCYVNKLYIIWEAEPSVILHKVTAYTGAGALHDVTVDLPGTSGVRTLSTIPLGGNYRIGSGLLDDFCFLNNDPTYYGTVHIYAYGAQIKHPV